MVYYLLLINALGLAIMLFDKIMAINNRTRVSEKTLLTIAAAGGSLGCLLAMGIVNHKTRHKKFRWGIPAMLVVQVSLFFVIKYL